MARSSLRIAYGNKVTASTTITASSAATNYPAAYLGNDFRAVRARTTGDSDENWVVDLGSAQAITCAALIDHNLSASATLEIRASTDNFSSSDVLIDTLSGAEITTTIIASFFASSSYRYWKFRVQDGTNPDGYISASRLFLGTYFTLARNYNFGWTRSRQDLSEVVVSSNGVPHFEVRPKRREPRYTFALAAESDADNIEALANEVGITQPFLTWYDIDNDSSEIDYVRLASMPTVTNTRHQRWNWELAFVEAL